MSLNINNVTLMPNDLNSSSIKYEYYTAYSKKTGQTLVKAEFEGVCQNLLDVKFIKWRCEQVLVSIEFGAILLIDFTQLEIANSSEVNILFEEYQRFHRDFCVIFKDEQLLNTFGKILFEHQKNTDVFSGMNNLIKFMTVNERFYRKFKESDFKDFLKEAKMNLHSIEESHVKCQLFRLLKNDKDTNIILINFWGDYRYGSGGDGDGDFISYRMREIFDVTMPIGMIINISNLQYTWGDNIDFYPYEIKEKNIPVKFIVDFSKEILVNEIRERDICKDLEDGLRMIMLSRPK
jgi:hypothetical protein